MTQATGRGADRIEALYRDYYQAIFGYVLRRAGDDLETVADLVAEVFVVAVRRPDAIPPPPQDRLWLYGVARRVVLGDRRRRVRKLRLDSLLRAQAATGGPGDDDEAVRLAVRVAMEQLRLTDREALQLVAWDGLTHAETARVLGCSVNAVAVRVHRAKTRLKAALTAAGVRPASAETVKSRSQS